MNWNSKLKVSPHQTAKKFLEWNVGNIAAAANQVAAHLIKMGPGYMTKYYENVFGIVCANGMNRKERRAVKFKRAGT